MTGKRSESSNRALHIAQKNELYALIKDVGIAWGEPIEDLRVYAKFIAQEWDDNLNAAINCFRDLKQQAIDLGLIRKGKNIAPNFILYLGKAALLYG